MRVACSPGDASTGRSTSRSGLASSLGYARPLKAHPTWSCGVSLSLPPDPTAGTGVGMKHDATGIQDSGGMVSTCHVRTLQRAGDRTRTGDVQLGKLEAYYRFWLYWQITTT